MKMTRMRVETITNRKAQMAARRVEQAWRQLFMESPFQNERLVLILPGR
jgi:hypothetical protein